MLVQEKVTKEKDTRSLRRPYTGRSPARLARSGARLTRRAHAPGARRSAARPFGGMEVHRTSMNTPPHPRAQTRGSLLSIPAAMLGGGYGVLKTPTEPWFFSPTPFGAPARRSPSAKEPEGRREGSRRSPARTGMSCRATSKARGERGGSFRAIRGVFLLVTSLCTSKEKSPWVGGGASQIQITRPQAARQKTSAWTENTQPKAARHELLV